MALHIAFPILINITGEGNKPNSRCKANKQPQIIEYSWLSGVTLLPILLHLRTVMFEAVVFQVLLTVHMRNAVFWNVTSSRLTEIN
jgi:hypothetical protein